MQVPLTSSLALFQRGKLKSLLDWLALSDPGYQAWQVLLQFPQELKAHLFRPEWLYWTPGAYPLAHHFIIVASAFAWIQYQLGQCLP